MCMANGTLDKEIELIWAAGFYDGEGNCTARPDKNTAGRKYANLQLAQIDRRVLDRFRNAVGFGKVYGPYVHAEHRRNPKKHPTYRYQCCAKTEVIAVVEKLWPYLSQVKREQLIDKLQEAELSVENYQTSWRGKGRSR